MIEALVARGFPLEDAEDAADAVIENILASPDRYTARLSNLDRHRGYFITAALNAYRMELRSQRRRRAREGLHHLAAQGHGQESATRLGAEGAPEQLLELIVGADLTRRQRRYVIGVLLEGKSIEQIAAEAGTSVAAVQAVLRRAAAILRELRFRSAG